MSGRKEKLSVIPGTLPDATNYPTGCRFYERCGRRTEACLKEPAELQVGEGHFAACFHTE
jgi:peptide/nickel transport system ATP-binding protein